MRPYLESTVWPELRESAAAHGAAAGLSTADLHDLRHLLTPGDPGYVIDEPGYFVVHPTLLATGKRPVEGGTDQNGPTTLDDIPESGDSRTPPQTPPSPWDRNLTARVTFRVDSHVRLTAAPEPSSA